MGSHQPRTQKQTQHSRQVRQTMPRKVEQFLKPKTNRPALVRTRRKSLIRKAREARQQVVGNLELPKRPERQRDQKPFLLYNPEKSPPIQQVKTR